MTPGPAAVAGSSGPAGSVGSGGASGSAGPAAVARSSDSAGSAGADGDRVRLGRGFYARPVTEVARDLLNKVLVGPSGRAGRIVEVEAYGGANDPGSHSFRGPTPRTKVMFGPPGRLYVYFTYGMHWCANAVAETDGKAGAVLLRALTPLDGIEAMRTARGPAAARDRDLCSGPAKLTQALGIDGAFNDTDLTAGSDGVAIFSDGTDPPPSPVCTTRIGLSAGADQRWRWYVPDTADISRP